METRYQCKYCIQWLPIRDYEQHMQQHIPQINERTISTITRAGDQVDYILTHIPQAMNNNGVLLQQAFKLFPFKSARYIYSPAEARIGIEAQSYEDFIYALKHCETITRLGRAWRKEHKIGDNKDPKQGERKVQYGLSTLFWAKEAI